jgi:hypothetical protein
VFSFYCQSSVHHHVKKLKRELGHRYTGLLDFIIHNLRKIKIRDIYGKEGIEAASKFAQHSKI